jgi:hypothetical protein
MNPQDITMECRMWHELTDTERRKRDVKCQLAVNRLEGMEHHIPPRKGEHCYFNSSRPGNQLNAFTDMTPTGRYICVTDQSQSIGVDFSVETPVDTYWTHYHYQGKLESISHDRGMGPLWRQRIS